MIAGLLVAGAIIFVNVREQKAGALGGGENVPAAAADLSKARPPSATDHVSGTVGAPIVMIEYSDFECPYCSMVYPTLKRIVAESNGQIAWIYRNMPLTTIHADAEPAAEAAECIADEAGNAGFWKFADDIFGNQSALSSTRYAALAKAAGADPAKFAACTASHQFKDKIATDSAEAQSLGAQGTPYILIINTKTKKSAIAPGALKYDDLLQLVKSVQ